MANIELEKFHLDRLIQAMNIKARVVKHESPDFILKTDNKEVGVELTRFFLPPQAGEKSQQELSGLGEMAVEQARRIFRKNGGTALYVDVLFSQYPQNKKDAYDLAERIAAIVSEFQKGANSHRHEVMLEDMFELSISPSVDGEDELRHGSSVGWVASVEANHIQSLINKKESKFEAYSRICSEVWLVIVLDIFRCGAPCQLECNPDKKFQSSFSKVIWLDSNIPQARVLDLVKPD